MNADGLLVMLALAGSTIADLQAQIEGLQIRNDQLTALLESTLREEPAEVAE